VLVESAKALDRAGAFLMVLECIPDVVAGEITPGRRLCRPSASGPVPNATARCWSRKRPAGLYEKFVPRFRQAVLPAAPRIKEALAGYVREVEDGTFPGPEHSFAAERRRTEEAVLSRRNRVTGKRRWR
jgi:3-methyl-2-oxobutanoate hydroxymethyltransferase